MEFSIKIIRFQTVLSGLKHEERRKKREKNPYYDIPILNWKFHKNIFLLILSLGCIQSFNLLLCLKLVKKFVVHVLVVGGVA